MVSGSKIDSNIALTSGNISWTLVTGQPNSGKTFAVKKMVDFLTKKGIYCKGFYTEEVTTTNGVRIGFNVVTVPDGKVGILSRKKDHPDAAKISTQKYKTGSYTVDVESFEALAIPSLTLTENEEKEHKGKVVYILDEIGRMELHSQAFIEKVTQLLRNQSQQKQDHNNNCCCRLVGAITAPIYGHRVPFCDEVSACKGVDVFKLTKKTRNDVLENILNELDHKWFSNKRKRTDEGESNLDN